VSRRRDRPRVLPAGDPEAIEAVIEAVRRGELVALPTETVYGIACALDPAAIERLLDAKRRPATKGITLLVDDLAQVRSLAEVPAAAEVLARRFWPGPLTLVLRARNDATLPEVLTGGRDTIGFRLPDQAAPRSIARALGPLPLTSANL
jgi:L-threonylcarbamoyladenylate synthase